MPALPASVDPAQRRGIALRLPWPAPALATWLAAWALWWALSWALKPAASVLGWPAMVPWVLATASGALLALMPRLASGWRRCFMAAGFPVSAALGGAAAGVPAWAWLLPLALLLAAYPLRAWRDAPLFPTPVDALRGLADAVPLPPGARVLDAGCGLGHGLAALRATWPQARLEGVEWSWPLRLASALRCPWARVRQGDMWAADWSGNAVVYLFQRPESMARAWAKVQAELAPGAWLVSLDFVVPDVEPTLALRRPGAQPVWAYRVAGQPPATPHGPGRSDRSGWVAQPAPAVADNPSNKPARPGRR